MAASIPADEMAQTLRVLAGDNAVNAARHFTRYSYYVGDTHAVALWSRTIQALVDRSAAPMRPTILVAEEVTQSRLVRERDALRGVRYEDVDAATLALEEPPAIVVRTADDWTGVRHGFARAASTAGTRDGTKDRAGFGFASAA